MAQSSIELAKNHFRFSIISRVNEIGHGNMQTVVQVFQFFDHIA